jgi:CRISPR-associated exonuclease Cas4
VDLLLLILALLLMGSGLLLWRWARAARQGTGLPQGEVIYSDTSGWLPQRSPLISHRVGLVGKPDYLVNVQVDGQTVTIPVEVKSRPQPRSPFPSHVLQLAAYCLLVEEKTGTPPPYGLLHYKDATLRIPYTPALRQQVVAICAEIRAARTAADLTPNHQDPSRCRNCGYREACGGGV